MQMFFSETYPTNDVYLLYTNQAYEFQVNYYLNDSNSITNNCLAPGGCDLTFTVGFGGVTGSRKAALLAAATYTPFLVYCM